VNDFLSTIVARTRERLRDLAAAQPEPVRDPFAFSRALRAAPALIAEIKSASPSAGPIVPNPDVERIAADYARGGAAAISIVTEPEFFHGSHEWIARAASASGLPVLMKDFVIDARQLMAGVAAGANAILLLASLRDGKQIREAIALLDEFGCDALGEVHDDRELDRALEGGARVIGVNNRDLRTFRVDLATAETLARRIPAGTIKVAESGIKTKADVERLEKAGFRVFLVGEALVASGDAVRTLEDWRA